MEGIKKILDFVCGAEDYDGLWFGEAQKGKVGKFWWRPVLTQEVEKMELKIRRLECQLAKAEEIIKYTHNIKENGDYIYRGNL